jgi:Uma2 family endonuclease
MSQTNTESNPIVFTLPPTQYDLPCDDGIPIETQRHKLQREILIDPLLGWFAEREDGYVGGNMFLYFSTAQIKKQEFRGPDVFVVLGVSKAERLSWVVWDEEKAPDVIIELISESTALKDRTEKKQIYQDRVRVPEYFWYNPFSPDDWAGFTLQNGVYQPISSDDRGQLISQRLGLALRHWQGFYKGVEATWLRWVTLSGELLPTPQEEAEQSQQQAELAQQQAELAQQQAKEAQQQAKEAQQQAELAQQQVELAQQRVGQLAARLREMGIDPEEI